MNAEYIYLIGTLLTWCGFTCLFLAAVRGVRYWLGSEYERPEHLKQAMRNLIPGTVFTVIAAFLPMYVSNKPGFKLPLVWMAMSLPAWMATLFIVIVIIKLIQSYTAITNDERFTLWKSAGVWLALAAVCIFWHSRLNEKITVLKGAVSVNFVWFVAVIALAIAAVAAMVYSERKVRTRGFAKQVATHAALIAGSVVFGIPFAWLLVTSFKEERDMSTANGLVWTPKVQLTHKFTDVNRPLVEAPYQGLTVKANVTGVLPDGRAQLEVERPYGLRGRRFDLDPKFYKPIQREAPIVTTDYQGQKVTAYVAQELDSGRRLLEVLKPDSVKGKQFEINPGQEEPVRVNGLRWENYSEAIEWMPLETYGGLLYLKNTLILVLLSVIGTVLSCSFVAYGFSRLRFPGRNFLFGLMLSGMMLPGAVTMMPSFLIFRSLGWIDTLLPLWVPTFFAGAFNVFLLRQFFSTIPMELEDSAKIDGCSYLRTYWQIMMPLIKPALAAIAIWTFMGAWNNFMGPLIYISSPENMPLAYALQLFQSDRGGSFGIMMAFSTMATIPVVVLFFVAQRWFIEGVHLSGLGGR